MNENAEVQYTLQAAQFQAEARSLLNYFHFSNICPHWSVRVER